MICSKTRYRINATGVHGYSLAGKKAAGRMDVKTAADTEGEEMDAQGGGFRLFRDKYYTEPDKAGFKPTEQNSPELLSEPQPHKICVGFRGPCTL
jgi:hypothetical protein